MTQALLFKIRSVLFLIGPHYMGTYKTSEASTRFELIDPSGKEQIKTTVTLISD